MAVTVLISNDAGLSVPIGGEEITAIARRVLAAEDLGGKAEVSVSIVGESEMRDLNRTWRGIDSATDVLSFACDAPAAPPPRGQPLELGDVILAPEVIARQAAGFKNTPADECRLMLVHGLLHLLGYDHEGDADAAVMEAREDALLRDLARSRAPGADASAVAVTPTARHGREEIDGGGLL